MAYYSIKYIKADPSGNTTVFVLTPLAREVYGAVAARLMEHSVLCAEQVGFLEKTKDGVRMQMMGGEFCGNASRSCAAWLAMARDNPFKAEGLLPLKAGERKVVVIEVSGSVQPLEVEIKDNGCRNGCFAEIAMPPPLCVEQGQDAALGTYSLVAFEGITHGVLWNRPPDSAQLERFRALLRRRGLDDKNCGLMFVESMQPLTIRPLVYIEETGSLVWENSCGSGSMAVLCAMADKTKQSYQRYAVAQPGGVLEVGGEYTQKGIVKTRLAGTVYFTAAGSAYINA